MWCDYEDRSKCDGKPVHFVGFKGGPFNYVLFCNAHEDLAQKDIDEWLANHPGVVIDEDTRKGGD